MVFVYEPVCVGYQHAEFNSFFIRMILKSFKEDVLFVCEKEHGAFVKDRLNEENEKIVLEDRFVFDDKDKYRRFSHIYAQYKKLFRNMEKCGSKKLIVTVTRKYELIIVNLLARKYKSIKVLMLFHAHLNVVMQSRYYKKILSSFTAKNVGYIVLSKNIKQSISEMAPNISKRIVAIHHALPSKPLASQHEINLTNVNFGFIGIATREKGEYNICEIAKKCSSVNCCFHYCGVVDDCVLLENMRDSGIVVHGGSSPLSFDDYFKAIQKLDYVILLLRKDAYEFRVSGTLIDAVNNETPVITLSNRYTDEVFSEFGDIGFLCGSDEEICSVIKKLSKQMDASLYNKQVELMRKMKNTLTVDFLAKEFSSQLNEFLN